MRAEGREKKERGMKRVKTAEAGRRGGIRSAANRPRNKAVQRPLNFRYSTPLGIYYSACGRGRRLLRNPRPLNAITASYRSRRSARRSGKTERGRDPRKILCARAFISLFSRGFFHDGTSVARAHFDLTLS